LKHADHRTLPVIAERFTIGHVLTHSWHAFVAGWRRFLPVAVVASIAVIIHAYLTGEDDMYASSSSFFIAVWVSSAIQSFAIAPITLGILDPGEARSESMLRLGYWTRALKIIVATVILQTAVYWPMAVSISFTATWTSVLIGYGVFALNAVAVGMLFSLFFPILLVERCSLWSSTRRSIRQMIPQVWRIAALTMLSWLIYVAGSTVVVLVAHSFGSSATDWLYYALWWPVTLVLVLVVNTVSAVTYRLLRIEREGPDPDQVAGVFE